MSDARPQLSAAEAAKFHYAEVLKYTGRAGAETIDPWDPKADTFMCGNAKVRADYTVGRTGSDFNSIQMAVSQAVADAATVGTDDRIYIAIRPGVYEETVIVPRLIVGGRTVSITLFGTGSAPQETVIRANIDQGMSGADFLTAFGAAVDRYAPEVAEIYRANAALDRLSTENACVLRVENDGFQAKNLTVHNAYNCDREDRNSKCEDGKGGPKNAAGQFARGWHQAVATLVHNADRVHFDHVRFSSFQDTLYFKGCVPGMTVRSYYSNCHVEGDIDFIFGRSTAFFESCEIRSLGSRVNHTYVVAPSTNMHTPYGIVFNDCDFTHDGSEAALAGTFSLGRQWFQTVRASPYGIANIEGYRTRLAETSEFDNPPEGTISLDVLEAVGKCVILNSRIGAHINASAPWDDWSGGRRNADGEFVPGEWNTRYRPVQYRSDDFFRYLGDWLKGEGLALQKPDPAEPWLAEFNNRQA
ncbi:pectinesterase family protein [uncultured Martelella sp.]|uniref:pectinesterase family protein n=1 Tax=uncultured Martelella sp. TaxID=392331 RepID=UPI0029C74831|nr:pectinesterase family protein [uncultured Martelella sp.]